MTVVPTPAALGHPHPEPRTYPLMLRTWTYAWWKPVVGVVSLVIAVFIAPIALFPLLALTIAIDHKGTFDKAFTDAVNLDHVTWQGMLWLNLSLAAMIPITWLIVRFVHRMRPRWLMSVQPGIRWPFFWACVGLAPVAMFASLAVGIFLPSDPNDLNGSPNHLTGRLVAIGVVVLFTTPLQAMGEEYAFRGYAMQAFGALTRRPWIAIVLSATLFALAHGAQNTPLFLDRFAFGLMAGYVVLKTGGLEAGIAMHIWNNLIAFGFALVLGNIDDSLNVSGVSWWNIPLTITQNGVYLVLVLIVARAMGIGERSTPPAVPPTEAPPEPPAGPGPPTGPPVLLPTSPPV